MARRGGGGGAGRWSHTLGPLTLRVTNPPLESARPPVGNVWMLIATKRGRLAAHDPRLFLFLRWSDDDHVSLSVRNQVFGEIGGEEHLRLLGGLFSVSTNFGHT